MQRSSNILIKALVSAVIVFAVAVIVEQIYISTASSRIETLQENSASLQTQVADAESTNATLTSSLENSFIEYRNAQGRLSMLGDGSGKVCYLTFDDGPDDELTPQILEILAEKDAVATWFCLADTEEYPYLNLALCKDIEAQGSAVGIHDWNQDSSYDYYKNGVDYYFDEDFNKARDALEQAVGHEIKICRFAGGSATIAYYNSEIATALPQEVISRGYQYFDWNVLAGDSDSRYKVDGVVPAETIVNNVLRQAESYAESDSPICVLMHDNPGKNTTVEALPEIIDGLREMGYEFATLTYDSPGFYQRTIY